jgi:hypothetical protein
MSRGIGPGIGCHDRDIVLAHGGPVSPQELLQQFFGLRQSDNMAFFKALNQK